MGSCMRDPCNTVLSSHLRAGGERVRGGERLGFGRTAASERGAPRMFGACVAEATMRPNPRSGLGFGRIVASEIRGAEYARESGMKRMGGGAKRRVRTSIRR